MGITTHHITTASMEQYTQISSEERNKIYLLLQDGQSQKEIAIILGRNPWTISREIRRNSTVFPKSKNGLGIKKKEDYHYLPDNAHRKYRNRRKSCGWRPPLKNNSVREYVIWKLREGWSPDIIAGTMRKEYPDNPYFRISHECIYQFIYSKQGEELNLKYCLVRAHKRRKKKTGRNVRKVSNIPNRVDISLRPEGVLERKEFGHFEGDSVLSAQPSKSALRTEVERMSRYILMKKIQRKTAECTKQATLSIYQKIPKWAVKSVTLDNGTEHVKHREISEILQVPFFFARPYHSWERWTNEHANGMIRRYFPKGTNFDSITDEQIQAVADCLNNRPRKILGYKTPKQVFDAHISAFS